MLLGIGFSHRRWALAIRSRRPDALDGSADRARSRAPAKTSSSRRRRVIDGQRGSESAIPRPSAAQARHELMVLRLVADVTRATLALESADAVLEARRPGNRPRPRPHLVARVGQERFVGGLGEGRIDHRERAEVRQQPRLRGVLQEAVGQDDHRGAVPDGDPRGVQGNVETVRRRGRGDDRDRGTPRDGRTSRAAGPPVPSWSAARSTGQHAERRPRSSEAR